jgi:hypothetical protein
LRRFENRNDWESTFSLIAFPIAPSGLPDIIKAEQEG